jgi:ribosomal protein S18 acetylase RimI-like enzyme
VEIRLARPEEYEVIADLVVAAYATVGSHERHPGYEPVLRDTAGRARHAEVLVAVEENRLLGTATFVSGPGPYAESEDPAVAGIRMLAVDPRLEGRGIGRALVEECVRRARGAGRARIELLTQPEMTRAHRLYEGLGFRRAPGRDWIEKDLHLLAYELAVGESARS